MGCIPAHTRSIAVAHEYGYGLLDLYAETGGTFLCVYDRNDDGGRTAVVLSESCRCDTATYETDVDDAGGVYCFGLCGGISVDGNLWF